VVFVAAESKSQEAESMPIKQTDPKGAHGVLTADPSAIYLDVRTEGEFANGHPAGAINVPVFFMKAGQMEPNGDFAAVVEKVVAKNRPLVVGCMAGGRSQRACEILEQSGFSDLTNVRGGFGGARDPNGTVVVQGWKDLGLPVSTDLGDASYQGLRKKAGF
jgi:rhodanese-related sulfurtransferase